MWPNYYPPDCPPVEAQPCQGLFYRLSRNDPPSSVDFIPLLIKNPKRNFIGQECRACGVSLFGDINDVYRLRKVIPAFRSHKIAQGSLTEDLGKLLHTPSCEHKTHHTWWVPNEVKPWRVFCVIQ